MIRDEDFYGLAAREIANQQFSQPLMAKAYALALGDAEKTKALYIGMRADQLKAEAAIIATSLLAEETIRRESEDARRVQEERERKALEKRKQKEAEEERRQRAEAEAQRAGDAWNRNDSFGYGYQVQAAPKRVEEPKAPEKPETQPRLSPEELDRIIESLKGALKPGKIGL